MMSAGETVDKTLEQLDDKTGLERERVGSSHTRFDYSSLIPAWNHNASRRSTLVCSQILPLIRVNYNPDHAVPKVATAIAT